MWCAPVAVCSTDACLSPLLCLFPVALPAWQSVCSELWSCEPKYKLPLRDVFIPAVRLSCWRLTLHPSVLPSIPLSLHPPILVWSFVPQQRGKATDNKRPCVFAEPLIALGKQDVPSFFCLLVISLPFSVCACKCVRSHRTHVRYSVPRTPAMKLQRWESTGSMCT